MQVEKYLGNHIGDAKVLLTQCQNWNRDDEPVKVIRILETIPEEERTPELDSELAQAYISLGVPSRRELLKRAVALLEPYEEYFQDNLQWNFRIGYSFFYLEQEGRALPYLLKVLEAHPNDEALHKFIDCCKERIALPQFQASFRERTNAAWEAFLEQEADLRRIMDEDKEHKRAGELIWRCKDILDLAFDNIAFEMGYGDGKYELILTPEGDKLKLFQLVYFQKHAPKKVLEHWDIMVGRKPIERLGMQTGDWSISSEEVLLWIEPLDKNKIGLSVYCEKLVPLLREQKGQVWRMLTTLTDKVLGEIPSMRCIGGFDVLETPKQEPSVVLSQLSDKLREMGLDLSTDPEVHLDDYVGYQIEPDQDENAGFRSDVFIGSTRCPSLIRHYLNDENDAIDDLHADGAVAGFFLYPVGSFTGENRSQQICKFQDEIEEKLSEACGPDAFTCIGNAVGIYCAYVDFIAWDLDYVLNMAKKVFDDTDLPYVGFHVFRSDTNVVMLKEPAE